VIPPLIKLAYGWRNYNCKACVTVQLHFSFPPFVLWINALPI